MRRPAIVLLCALCVGFVAAAASTSSGGATNRALTKNRPAQLLADSSSSSSSGGVGPTCQSVIAAHYPKQYVTYRADRPPVMDGRLDEPFWEEVPFTDDFIDISTDVKPRFRTRAKIRWDDDWVYVGGMIEDTAVWANITHTCHCIDPNEDQVIFHDNDFEVFFDVDGTCHWYKEYEMNAANQNWDLLLDAPYENGGYENSSRVYGKAGFDMVPPLNCSTYINGTLNDPASHPTFWSVEIMFPVKKLLFHTTLEEKQTTPKDKQFWRINFSRVEWAVKVINGRYEKFPSCQSCPNPGADTCDNWVWSPMYVIDVHHPEMWGFLQFSSDAPRTTPAEYNVEWPARYVAHELYYAQVGYFGSYKAYANNTAALLPFADYNVTLNQECTKPISIWTNGTAYVALIPDVALPLAITITQDRYILAHTYGAEAGAEFDSLESLQAQLHRFAR